MRRKILLVSPKTYRGRFDISFWNFYIPLLEMGYDVEYFDTFRQKAEDIDGSKYDLVFCILTNNPNFSEPTSEQLVSWDTITLNWFCDDSWRFWNFSLKVAHNFDYVVTTEPTFVEEYKKLDYENVILSNWHANPTVYIPSSYKTHDVCFIGAPTQERLNFIAALEKNDIPVKTFDRLLAFEDMCLEIASSKIALNFSKNENNDKTQMKARMFEVPALRTLLVTEYHPGIEEYYTDKEIVTFKTEQEMINKVRFLLNKPNLIPVMSENGYSRFLKDHTSQKRLREVLDAVGI